MPRRRIHALALLLLLCLAPALSENPTTTCSTSYAAAADAHRRPPPPPAAHTRATTKPRSFALVPPDARVYGPPPPGWSGAARAAAVVTPALGAHFAMYLVDSPGPAAADHPVAHPAAPPRLERFVYVLSGAVTFRREGEHVALGPGGFAYVAPGDDACRLSTEGASFVLIDRVYAGDGVPVSRVGKEEDVEVEDTPGEVFRLRRLLNPADPALDFNIHIMDFSPGEYLNVKEVHYNQHGLLMLRGHGIYRLDDTFLPVATGDVIYLAPFVPQWYAALGSSPTRYFLYKDVNVNPLTTP